MKTRTGAVIVTSLCLIAPGFSQGDFKFDVAVEEARLTAEKENAALFDKYAKAVERLQEGFQTKGDLASAVKARDEAQKARDLRVMGSDEFLGITKLRSILEAELGKIRLAELDAVCAARVGYLEQLSDAATQLTKAGKLDEALELSKKSDAERARLDADRQQIAALRGDDSPARASLLPEPSTARSGDLEPVNDSPLTDKEPLTGEVTLAPGIHRLRDRAVIGIRGYPEGAKKRVDIRGHVVAKAGTALSGGQVYIHNGTFKATETLFSGVRLSEELQGRWTLKSCLLDDCQFKKDGGWEAGPYSARWDFDNCVFKGSFFESWGSIGLNLTNCSFHDIKFYRFTYHKDAGKEARSDGRRIKDCLFVDCTIPASTALATENCLFRNCRFTNDLGPDPVVDTEIETVLYFDGNQFPDPPKLPDRARLVFKPLSEAEEKSFGSTVPYLVARGKLEFE